MTLMMFTLEPFQLSRRGFIEFVRTIDCYIHSMFILGRMSKGVLKVEGNLPARTSSRTAAAATCQKTQSQSAKNEWGSDEEAA